MADFSRLATTWRHWAPNIGGGRISVSADHESAITFRSEDYSVHLYHKAPWWQFDTVNDRGQRNAGAGKFSSYELAEKFFVWDWATTANSSLASGILGVDLRRKGYQQDVVVVSHGVEGQEICSGNDCAILSTVYATIFSHLMKKSVTEIETMIRDGLQRHAPS